MKRKIEIVEYNPIWPQLFKDEAKLIKKALGDNCVEIHHIGSTSVPGLAAKPIIDILPVVRDITMVDDKSHTMEALGYIAKGEYGIPMRRFFQKESDSRIHHLHVFEQGNPEIIRHINFRNWLCTNTEDLLAYAALKKDLAAQFPNDIVTVNKSHTC